MRYRQVKGESTKPAVCQIQVNITAKLTVRLNPKQITDQLHPKKQYRIDGSSSIVLTVEFSCQV
ncbi:hypothetical protein, partial [Nitrosomonas sp. JL21]|uniref:hypothetical protein n=1 Tax=Nitrosomonas sp. JL21 TaxID=153949 RepID=UPI001F045856